MAAPKRPFVPTAKDDGSRWVVVNAETGQQVYPGAGLVKSEAERLGKGLVAPSMLRCVKEAEDA